MADVFIAYSRKDRDFVRKLHEALAKVNRDAWVDWQDIPPTAEWLNEVFSAIASADTVVFVISPDSVRSAICKEEVANAVKDNKRLVPIVCRDVDTNEVPEALSKLNWIFFREEDDFDAVFQSLIKAIETDLDWVRAHTRLIIRAREWEAKGFDKSLLLRGNDLREAEQWLGQGADREPKPTSLQTQYILSSRKAASRRQRVTLGAVTIGLIMTAVLSLVSLYQRQEAVRQGRISLSRQLATESLSRLDSQLDLALLLSLEACRVTNTVEARSSLLCGLEYQPEIITFLRGHGDGVKEGVREIAFSPDGRTLASATDDAISLWDVYTGRPIGEPLTGHTDHVNSVAFSPNGKTLASGSDDGTIILWDVETGRSIGEPLTRHRGLVNDVTFSPDGKTLASGSDDSTIILWDVETHRPIGKPLAGHRGAVTSVAFSPDGRTLGSGSYDHTIKFWDAETSTLLGSLFIGLLDWANSINFSSNGSMLASGGTGNSVILWDIRTIKPTVYRLAGHETSVNDRPGRYESSVNSVHFSPDAKALASGSDDGTIILWDVETRRAIGKSFIGREVWVKSVAFSPDGKTLVSVSWDSIITLWDVETGRSIGEPLTRHRGLVNDVTFSPDGKTLASGSDSTIILWDVETHGPIGEPLTGHRHVVTSVVFSPDGKTLASGSDDSTIILWDVETHRPIGEPLTRHRGLVNSVTFSPDGKILASGSDDSTIILWDVETHRPIGEPLTRHRGLVNSVTFSPDGRTLASATDDDAISLWDVYTGRPIGEPLTGHTDHVNSVAFSPNGKTLASGSDDYTIILWDVETHRVIGKPLTGQGCDLKCSVNSVAFSPDGKTLASGSDNNLLLLDVDFESWKARACRKANRNLTREEWKQYIGDTPYRKTCPDLPGPD